MQITLELSEEGFERLKSEEGVSIVGRLVEVEPGVWALQSQTVLGMEVAGETIGELAERVRLREEG